MGRGISLPLGIDFGRLDRDLNKVADHIEGVGKSVKIQLGGAGGINVGDSLAGIGDLGDRLATGIANGVRSASSLLLGFTAHIDGTLNRVGGAAITLFQRVDAAMKFPTFDAFFRGAAAKLGNFAAFWRQPLSDLDLAIAGAFGGTIAKAARVVKAIVDQLTATIANALKAAVAQLSSSIAESLGGAVAKVVAEFERLNQGVVRTEASARMLLGTVEKTAAVPNQFSMGGGGLKTSIPGPKIGAGTDFTESVPAAKAPELSGWQQFGQFVSKSVDTVSRSLDNMGVVVEFAGAKASQMFAQIGGRLAPLGAAASAAAQAMGTGFKALTDVLSTTARGFYLLGRIIVAPFALLGSVVSGAVAAVRKTSNFLGSLGDVAGKTFDQIYRGGIRIATLGIFGRATKDAQGFNSTLGETKTSVGQVTGAVKSLGVSLLTAFGVVGVIYKATQFIIGGVKAASDLNQTVAQSKVVFGDSFGAVEAQANRLNSAFRISKAEQLGVANSFGSIAQGAGLSERASAGLANQLTGMAGNLASSVGISFAEAGDAIKSGLVGRGIELKGLGVVMDESTVKAYGLSRGFAQVGGELTKQSEVQARAELIMRGLSFAQGALQRNAGSSADQFRKAGGGIQEFGLKIGELLLPAVTAATEGFNEFLAITLDAFDAMLPTVRNWASVVTGALAQVGVVARNFGDFWKIAQLRVGEFVINTVAYIETIPANFGVITGWIGGNWKSLLVDMGSLFTTWAGNMLAAWRDFGVAIWDALKTGELNFDWNKFGSGMLDGFKATAAELPDLIKPDLISVEDEVNRILDNVASKEAARAKAMAGPAPVKAGPLNLDKEKGKEYKLASAVEINSKEASSIIAKTQAAGRGNAGKDQLAVAKDSNSTLKEIRDGVKNPKPQFKVA